MAGETPPRPRCLWMLTHKSIMGIYLENLLQLGKENNINFNWNFVLPFPSDFIDDQLPNTELNPFLYDSKLFLSCGFASNGLDRVSSKFYQVSFQYNKPIEISEDSSSFIPPLPTKFKNLPRVVNIRGKVYLFNRDRSCLKRGLWVLDPPGTKDWISLHPPPPLRDYHFGAFTTFVLRDKLFFYCLSEEGLYVLDNLMGRVCRGNWKKVDNKVGSILQPFTEVSLPLVPQHQVVALSWKLCFVGPIHKQQARVKFFALLLDISNNSVSVSRYQPLFGPLSSTLVPSPIFDIPKNCVVKFVDLGNNLVCALVTGMIPEDGNSYWKKTILCVSVFSLSLSSDAVAVAQESSTSTMKNQRFLDVDVRVDRAFLLPDFCLSPVSEKEKEKEWNFLHDELDEEAEEEEKKRKEEEKERNKNKSYWSDDLNHAFIFPYMEELPHVHDDACSKGTESPPRKLRKLASRKYPR